MRGWADIFFVVAAAALLALSFAAGRQSGIRSAPEYVASKEQQMERDVEFWREISALETDRSRMCDRIIEDVGELLFLERASDVRTDVQE